MDKRTSVLTWADVGILASQIERQTTRIVTITLATVSSSYSDGHLSLGVTLSPRSGDISKRKTVRAVGSYPQRSARSMTGAVIKCLYEALERAEKADNELRAAAQVPLPIDE